MTKLDLNLTAEEKDFLSSIIKRARAEVFELDKQAVEKFERLDDDKLAIRLLERQEIETQCCLEKITEFETMIL